MVIIGLTGSIGMGKTTTARMLSWLGVPVHDADAAVHGLMARGGAAVSAVAAAFPGVERDGAIDRKALGARVFGDPVALRRLESILHPAVRTQERRFLARCARRRVPVVALDIPLLFETKGERRVDLSVVVSAPAFVQRVRVLARPGMTPERLAAVLARQMPDRRKRRLADVVVPSGQGRGVALRTVRRLVKLARRASGCHWPPPPASPYAGLAGGCRGLGARRRSCAKSSWTPKPPASTRSAATASSKSAASS